MRSFLSVSPLRRIIIQHASRTFCSHPRSRHICACNAKVFSCTSPDITTPSPGSNGPTVPLYPASCCKIDLLAVLEVFCENRKLPLQPFFFSILSQTWRRELTGVSTGSSALENPTNSTSESCLKQYYCNAGSKPSCCLVVCFYVLNFSVKVWRRILLPSTIWDYQCKLATVKIFNGPESMRRRIPTWGKRALEASFHLVLPVISRGGELWSDGPGPGLVLLSTSSILPSE